MRTLTVEEATASLDKWLELALAGEQIQIQKADALVELRPSRAVRPAPVAEALAPREALRRLQQDARLSTASAQNYLREVHEERLAAARFPVRLLNRGNDVAHASRSSHDEPIGF